LLVGGDEGLKRGALPPAVVDERIGDIRLAHGRIARQRGRVEGVRR
jgi:hypothetical protein